MSEQAETRRISPIRRYAPTVVMVLAIGFVWFGLKEFKTPGPPPELNTSVAVADAFNEEGDPVVPAIGAASTRPRVVEFYTENCPACRQMRPAIDRLRDDCTDGAVEVVLINLYDPRNLHLAERYQLRGVPTVSLFDATGTETGRLVGSASLRVLRRAAADLAETPCAGEDGASADDLAILEEPCPTDSCG
jgi:thiol-disulfide isomerase/thioredoxin